MDKTYLFYALSASSDPETIRYIGVTSQTIEKRFYQHKYCAMHKRKLPVHKWMYSHLIKGENILCRKLTEASEQDWEQVEKNLIKRYRIGGKLLNIDNGGKGVVSKEKRTKDSIQRSCEGHFKEIILLDYYGNIIDRCKSCTEASKKYNLSKTAIGNVISGRSNTAGGYYIVTSNTFDNPSFNPIKFVDECNKRAKIKLIFEFDLKGSLKHIYKSKLSTGIEKGTLRRALDNKWSLNNSFWAYTRTINICEYTIRES